MSCCNNVNSVINTPHAVTINGKDPFLSKKKRDGLLWLCVLLLLAQDDEVRVP